MPSNAILQVLKEGSICLEARKEFIQVVSQAHGSRAKPSAVSAILKRVMADQEVPQECREIAKENTGKIARGIVLFREFQKRRVV